MQHPSHRLIQLGTRSLGFDPGIIDSWWGGKTRAAVAALLLEGPAIQSDWAVQTLHRGLKGLGYMQEGIEGTYGAATRAALRGVLDADGAHAASAAPETEVLVPSKPLIQKIDHSLAMRQGSAGTVINSFMIHCAAVPGDWHVYKTNNEIISAVHRMHTDPKSRGGRGWSDTGYHSITCPDGERFDARPWARYGAGAIGYNRGVYHHLMIEVGTITRIALPEAYFTPATLDGTKAHIELIAKQTPLRRLMGHREVAAKLCPGFEVVDRDWTDRAVT
jgi:hypothetical protein